MQRIVVGIDGSDKSLEALRWALGEAVVHNAEVEAVYAYDDLAAAEGVAHAVEAEPEALAEAAAARAAERLEASLAAAVAPPGVSVRPVVVAGPATRVLIERSSGADLLVVGSRGRGGVQGMLLGSVGHQCVQHAMCPVLVIPAAYSPRSQQSW